MKTVKVYELNGPDDNGDCWGRATLLALTPDGKVDWKKREIATAETDNVTDKDVVRRYLDKLTAEWKYDKHTVLAP